MSAYLGQCEDLDREETRRLSEKVKAHARLTLETLDQVISVMPDMAEVYNVIIKMKKSHPGTGLLEVIGPVFCNTTRHFLLIQVSIISSAQPGNNSISLRVAGPWMWRELGWLSLESWQR